MTFLKQKKGIAALAAVAVVAIGAIGAYAYWTTTGSGTGSAGVGTSTPLTITQLGSVSNLVPGGPAQDIDFRVANGASFNQYVTGVTVVVDPAWSAGTSGNPCNAADFTVTPIAWTAADLTPGNHDYVGAASGAKIAMINQTSNQDDCKGATVPLVFASN